jgi:hypothetical protein
MGLQLPSLPAERRKLAIVCSACGAMWDGWHQCTVPPQIDFSRYSDGALKELAGYLKLVLEGRAGARQELSTGLVSMDVPPPKKGSTNDGPPVDYDG